MTVQSIPAQAISPQDLSGLLEPLIRRIVREELAHVAARRPDVFYLPKDSPLRDDLVDILDRKQRGEISLLSQTEVWGE
jgi:hypothetical protein